MEKDLGKISKGKKMKEVALAGGWKKWIRVRFDISLYHLGKIRLITWRNTCKKIK